MKNKGIIAVSNRHVHLTEETYKLLFNDEISIKRPLNQIGEFASCSTVTLKGPKGIIESVRVVGPFRKYNQVEVLKSDCYTLGINPPVRASGDLNNSEDITLVTKKSEITLKSSCIIAERHVHMNKEQAQKLNLNNNDLVRIKVNNDKGGTMHAHVKITDNGFYEIHIDRDDASAFLLTTGDEVEFEK